MEAAIRRRRAYDEGSDSSDDVSVRGDEGSLEDRRISQEEFDRRREIIETHGMPVRLIVNPLPEDSDLYEANTQEWVDDENSERGGYYRDRAELLMISLVPVRNLGAGFQRLRERPRRRGQPDYHISLCFTNELHRFNLYDRHQGVQRGKAAYQTLRNRYNGRLAVLRGRVRRTSFELNGRTHVHQLTVNNIVRDDDVWALHDCGSYHDRPLHVSL
jgi:hypothetical protein